MTREEVLNQLSKPQRVIVKVCENNWDEIKQSCSDVNGNTCGVTGNNCKFGECPKMKPKEVDKD